MKRYTTIAMIMLFSAIRVEPKVDPSFLPKPAGEKKARVSENNSVFM